MPPIMKSARSRYRASASPPRSRRRPRCAGSRRSSTRGSSCVSPIPTTGGASTSISLTTRGGASTIISTISKTDRMRHRAARSVHEEFPPQPFDLFGIARLAEQHIEALDRGVELGGRAGLAETLEQDQLLDEPVPDRAKRVHPVQIPGHAMQNPSGLSWRQRIAGWRGVAPLARPTRKENLIRP